MIGDGAPPDWTDDRAARASQTEIVIGDLVLPAPWRNAAHQRAAAPGPATSTSVLSVDEFAALRSVGFEPVGQVMGSADVFDLAWTSPGCGHTNVSLWGTPREVPWPWPVAKARHGAVDGMRRECARLGGHGVVGVRLMTRPFLGNQPGFTAIGTAVRVGPSERVAQPGAVAPFATDLSGQEFAKLACQGWLPVGLVMGYGEIICHQGSQWVERESWGELRQATEVVQMARRAARANLGTEAARFPGATVLARAMTLDVGEVGCTSVGGYDYVVAAFIVGTAIVPFDPVPPTDPARDVAALSVIMRLDRYQTLQGG
jgi:uncharacterized protein YbjQ (UPF0145 family)